MSASFDELVALAMRHQPLPGVQRGGRASIAHHWMMRVERFDATRFRVFVGPGAVNDRVAAITYLVANDPRGWTPAPDYPGLARQRAALGLPAEAPLDFVERPLTERTDPPHLLITVPAADRPQERGDFRLVADAVRPPAFRGAAEWECELYEAVVFLTASPAHYSRVETELHQPLLPQLSRYRVALAPSLPSLPIGGLAAQKELAHLYLLRSPGRPGADRLLIQQRTYWSLWTMTAQAGIDFPTNHLGVGPLAATIDLIIAWLLEFLAGITDDSVRTSMWTS